MFQSHQKPKISSIPTCSICKNQFDSYYRIPRVIPKCGHTFCQKCINNNIGVKANRKIFTCYECQSEIIIRKGTNQDIPKNIGVLDIVKSLKKKQYEENSPLNHNNSSNKFANKQNNNLIQKNQYQSPIKNNQKSKQYCTQHPNKQLDLICQTCKYLKVCSICVLVSHNNSNNTHLNHKFIQYIPATNLDINQVNQVFSIIQDSIEQTILPQSPYNILKKSQTNIINSLTSKIHQHFRQNYYKIIQKKQNQIINQLNQIKLQTASNYKIQQIAKIYDLLKIQHNEILQKTQKKQKYSIQIIEEFIKKCKNLHNQIEQFSQCIEKYMKKMLSQIGNKICQTLYLKIVQVPVNLKNLLTGEKKSNNESPDRQSKYDTRSMNAGSKSIKNSNVNINILEPNIRKKTQNHQKSFHITDDYFEQADNNDLIINKKQKPSSNKNLIINTNNPSSNHNQVNYFPPKSSIISKKQVKIVQNKNTSSHQTLEIPDLQLQSRQQIKNNVKVTRQTNTDRVNSSNNNNKVRSQILNNQQKYSIDKKKQTNKNMGKYNQKGQNKSNSISNTMNNNDLLNKSHFSNSNSNNGNININNNNNTSIIHNIQQVKQPHNIRIKQQRPVKQLPLNLKAKYNQILKQITRQNQQNTQSLQLIGMQINDNLILYICQYLRMKKLQFSMIKLVKNMLTDEGMSILLGYLINNETTQVLNLTSNQLTGKSLQLIIEFGQRNNVLKTIYLLNNKVTVSNVKSKKDQLQRVGVEIVI